mmetsp:Transcript_53542/g.64469  ORF Transcript_53542/g.64469 Transcript_53542/m.64469 type:complete len:112 (-) Transcript_53542:312-647(-)
MSHPTVIFDASTTRNRYKSVENLDCCGRGWRDAGSMRPISAFPVDTPFDGGVHFCKDDAGDRGISACNVDGANFHLSLLANCGHLERNGKVRQTDFFGCFFCFYFFCRFSF